MNASVSSSVDGKDYEKAMENAIERAIAAVAVKIEGDAIVNVPVDTGRLRGSITYATKKKRSYPKKAGDGVSQPAAKWTAHVGTNVEYAQHVEYGTRRRPGGQPYLRPALDSNKSIAPKLFQQEVEEGLKRGK